MNKNYEDVSKSVHIKDFLAKGRSSFLNIDTTQSYAQYKVTSFSVPLENVFFYKYRDILFENSEVLILNEQNYNKYKYRPKKLSYDFYGLVDYWYILMILNNATRISQFNKREIRYIPFEKLDVIDSILQKESENKAVLKIDEI